MSTVYGYFRPWQGKAFQRKSPLQKNALPAALQSSIEERNWVWGHLWESTMAMQIVQTSAEHNSDQHFWEKKKICLLYHWLKTLVCYILRKTISFFIVTFLYLYFDYYHLLLVTCNSDHSVFPSIIQYYFYVW